MSEYQILNNLIDSSVLSSGVEILAISQFVPSWIMKVNITKSSSLKVAQIVIDALVSFTTVRFVIAKEEIYNVGKLVSKIEPLSHHLLPGLVATCDAANVGEMCTLLQPYTMLETCLSLIKHMQAPQMTFLIGGKGHSIARIRQQTNATIKIHPDKMDKTDKQLRSNYEQEPQKVEIAAPTKEELARAQQLVLTRLSLRQ
ncbi:hypothetical protein CANINC_003211 [Pichia inconspicua]|uniref:K Homology domain-containing protein n=1 Tax=Pichia inconspicua TaxID=52247 RepID=A0A4V6TTQ8_9ASCO|nr:hypothetical protein CANINC_003211 [[Candida] inconspicua]